MSQAKKTAFDSLLASRPRASSGSSDNESRNSDADTKDSKYDKKNSSLASLLQTMSIGSDIRNYEVKTENKKKGRSDVNNWRKKDDSSSSSSSESGYVGSIDNSGWMTKSTRTKNDTNKSISDTGDIQFDRSSNSDIRDLPILNLKADSFSSSDTTSRRKPSIKYESHEEPLKPTEKDDEKVKELHLKMKKYTGGVSDKTFDKMRKVYNIDFEKFRVLPASYRVVVRPFQFGQIKSFIDQQFPDADRISDVAFFGGDIGLDPVFFSRLFPNAMMYVSESSDLDKFQLLKKNTSEERRIECYECRAPDFIKILVGLQEKGITPVVSFINLKWNHQEDSFYYRHLEQSMIYDFDADNNRISVTDLTVSILEKKLSTSVILVVPSNFNVEYLSGAMPSEYECISRSIVRYVPSGSRVNLNLVLVHRKKQRHDDKKSNL